MNKAAQDWMQDVWTRIMVAQSTGSLPGCQPLDGRATSALGTRLPVSTRSSCSSSSLPTC